MTTTEAKVLYRYEEVQTQEMWSTIPKEASRSMSLYQKSFPIIKETPCGCWISIGYFNSSDQKKFVNLKARKKWAHPTPEEAMDGFRARKERQLRILKGQVLRTQAALYLQAENAIPVSRGMIQFTE